MATLATLRKEAKEAGVNVKLIKGARTASELQSIIEEHTNGSKPKSRGRAVVKKAVRKATVRKARKSTSRTTRKATPKASPARVGNSRARKSAPARSQGKAKRQTATRTSSYVPKGGRNVLGNIDYDDTEGWNPREGSAPDRIIKALRKYKGNREKVFQSLVGQIGDFVKPRRQNGEKFSKQEREDMLRYRIARTDWDFAIRTGQHDKAENRVEYGTGGTGDGIFKPAKRKPAAKKATPARKATRKASTRKATTARRSTTKARTTRSTPKASTARRKAPVASQRASKTRSTAKARSAGRTAARRKR